MDEKLLLTIMGVVFLVLQFIFQMVTKRSNSEILAVTRKSNEKILEKMDNVIGEFTNMTQGIVKEIQSRRAGYSEKVDKIYSNTHDTIVQMADIKEKQRDISSILLETTLAQRSNIACLERLLDRITAHTSECKERGEKIISTVTQHVADTDRREAVKSAH